MGQDLNLAAPAPLCADHLVETVGDPEDFLFLCDRRRDLVISGGVNIYSELSVTATGAAS